MKMFPEITLFHASSRDCYSMHEKDAIKIVEGFKFFSYFVRTYSLIVKGPYRCNSSIYIRFIYAG